MFDKFDWQQHFLFDTDEPTGGDPSGTPDGEGDGSGTGTPPDNTGGNPDNNTPQDDNAPWLKARLEREAAKARAKFLEELGVEDMDSAKARLQAQKDAEDAQKSELERLQDQLQASTQRQAELEQQLQAEKQTRINDKRNSAIRDAARSAGAVDAEDVMLNVMKDVDALAKLVNEDGSVNAEAVTSAVTQVKTDKPHLFSKQVPGTPSNRHGQAPSPDKKALKQARKTNQSIIRG